MNKRHRKKREQKYLPVIADEVNFCTMTKEEIAQAIKDKEEYRKKYGYRKKYKDLKGKCLIYYYPMGKEHRNWMLKVANRCRKKSSYTITQSINDFVETPVLVNNADN